jgi:hypothetical protein
LIDDWFGFIPPAKTDQGAIMKILAAITAAAMPRYHTH